MLQEIKRKLYLYRYELKSRGLVNFLTFLLKSVSMKKWKQYLFIGITAGTVISSITVLSVYIMYKNNEDYIDRSLKMYSEWMVGKGNFPEKPPVKIYSANKTLIGEYLVEHNSRMTLNTCKNLKWLNQATISAEDREFYTHNGISYRGILRAFVNNILSFRPREGAGSITQQLARNLYTTKAMPVVLRKIYETFGAFYIEDHMSKDEILCLYLNKIYMGEGRYGAEEASYFYFQKPPDKLTAAEAAMIVGLYPSPVRYSPLNNIESSMKKQKMVLEAMTDNGYFKKEDIDETIENFKKKYRVKIVEKTMFLEPEDETKEFSSPGRVGLYGANRFFKTNLAPDVNEYVRHFLLSSIDEDEIVTPGLKVYTTIDYSKQKAANHSIRSVVESIRKNVLENSGISNDEKRKLIEDYNGVFIAMEPSGDIRAMVGGFRIAEDQYMDRVWNMLRQPGSAIKGFLYAMALDEEIVGTESIVVDEAINIRGYSPKNWYRGYRGEITLKKAVALSVNTIAVKTLDQLGASQFKRKMSQAADISPRRFESNLSLALGTGEVTPIELARLYAVLLNSGKKVYPRLITKIESPGGETISDFPSEKSDENIISSGAAKKTLHLLKEVIEDEEGTAHWIKNRKTKSNLDFSIAGKTGTVQTDESIKDKFGGMNGIHDAWFVGIVPGEVGVVWVGHDLGAPFEGSGAGTAAGVWMYYAEQALKNKTKKRFDLFDKEGSAFESFWSRFKKRKNKTEEQKPENPSNDPKDNVEIFMPDPAEDKSSHPEN
ncbi:MAG: transglycosylase domain-containing protein [Spirochaetia bacterium]|nr:transglycosylase domain-containing protein [Spirochaetia bacterium]